jgi:hypothetical protein
LRRQGVESLDDIRVAQRSGGPAQALCKDAAECARSGGRIIRPAVFQMKVAPTIDQIAQRQCILFGLAPRLLAFDRRVETPCDVAED